MCIEKDGFIKIENFLTKDFVSSVKSDVEQFRFSMNKNQMSGVHYTTQYFFPHLMTVSKSFVDFLTSSFIVEFLKIYFKKKCRLKSLRYYETFGKHHMQWHTDNKTSEGFAKIPGLIFIFYCADVIDGEFQYIKGSHLWSSIKGVSDYSDQWVQDNCANNVESFCGDAGTLIIYNSYGIHRAKPVEESKFVRKSVFFQVDSKVDDGEPLLINPSLFNPSFFSDSWSQAFLGIGQESNYLSFPQSGPHTLPYKELINFSLQILKSVPKRFIKALLPKKYKLVKRSLNKVEL